MTKEQKLKIAELRQQGFGYKKIAKIIQVSDGTVKTYCHRAGLTAPELISTSDSFCQYCEKPLIQLPGRKQKRFCSDSCRNKWWNSHLDIVKRKALYTFVCPGCGKEFTVYGNANRKYCCHECYIKDRFRRNKNDRAKLSQ